MATITSKYSLGGYQFGLGVTTSMSSGGTAEAPTTRPKTAVTVDQLIIYSDHASDLDALTVEVLKVNDVDLLLNRSASVSSGNMAPWRIWAPDSVVAPSFLIAITQQDVNTLKFKNNHSSDAGTAAAYYTAAYASPGTGVENAVPALAPRFGEGRAIGFGQSTSVSNTFSGNVNTHAPLALDFLVGQSTDASVMVSDVSINDEQLQTGGSVPIQSYRSDCPRHPMYGIIIDKADTISISYENNSSSADQHVCFGWSARIAA